MVQIKVTDPVKPPVQAESESLTTVTSTTPRNQPEIRAVRVLTKTESSRCHRVTVVLFVLLGISFMATVKRLCDYKEDNYRLAQELVMERQKDALLKEAVKSNVPEETFSLLAKLPPFDYDLEVNGEERGWFSVNLNVLWNSPSITPCDMARLAHMLTMEIYHHSDILDIVQAQPETESPLEVEYPEFSPQEEDLEEIKQIFNSPQEAEDGPTTYPSEEIVEVDEILFT